MSHEQHHLSQSPHLWRGYPPADHDRNRYVSTGFDQLDALLPGGGWPRGRLTELVMTQEGAGELQLIMPALSTLSRDDRWLAWITPPYIPFAPALSVQGVDLSKILVVHPRVRANSLWALEQALRSGTCSAVLAWSIAPDTRVQRRLQLAAEIGGSVAFLFYSDDVASTPSFSALRLHLRATPRPNQVSVHIVKRKGGWPCKPVEVTLNGTMAESLFSPYRNRSG